MIGKAIFALLAIFSVAGFLTYALYNRTWTPSLKQVAWFLATIAVTTVAVISLS
jgi:hypothetical protein